MPNQLNFELKKKINIRDIKGLVFYMKKYKNNNNTLRVKQKKT